MTDQRSGDQRIRQRVPFQIAAAISAVAVTSRRNPDILWCTRHYLSIVPSTNTQLTAGIVSIRGIPAGAPVGSPFWGVPIGIEAVNLALATDMNFCAEGFFQGFAVNILVAVTGGTIDVWDNAIP